MDRIEVIIDGQSFSVELMSPVGKRTELIVDGVSKVVTLSNWQEEADEWHWFEVDGCSFELDIDPELRWIKAMDGLHRVDLAGAGPKAQSTQNTDGHVKAPIPGLVTRVFVEAGQTVRAGQPLLTLEAMKMENEICAPRNGQVCRVNVFAGKSVSLNEVMLVVE